MYFDSGIGGGIDSFYEYLMKAHLLTGKQSYLDMFEEGVNAINRHVRTSEGWYVDVNMHGGGVMFPYYRSLQSFWPGLLTLWGDLQEARPLFDKFYSIWRKYSFLPEAYNLQTQQPQPVLCIYLAANEYLHPCGIVQRQDPGKREKRRSHRTRARGRAADASRLASAAGPLARLFSFEREGLVSCCADSIMRCLMSWWR